MLAALVGIDGIGKTTVARRLRQACRFTVVHAIRAHDDPESQDAELSRRLAAASAAADAVGRAELKVAVLYLQLCLYGPAERRATGSRLVCDRHPLIDPLVYLPLYARIAAVDCAGAAVEQWWGMLPVDVAGSVRDWLRACHGGEDVWGLGVELLRLAARSPQALLDELIRRFGVSLPDAVLFLDLPVTTALDRLRARAAGAELHETAAGLAAVRSRYGSVLEWLEREHPEVGVHRLDCSHRTVDEVSAAVLALLS